jgi:hypothetical protein
MRLIVITGLMSSFLLCSCTSKVLVKPVISAPTLNGIPYALPKTVVGTTVTVQRVEDNPGAYAGYASCFFPDLTAENLINDITYSTEIQYSVKSASFSTRGIPDPAHTFVIDATAGWLHKKTLNAQLTEDGLLSKSDVETKNEAVSFTVSTLKTLATIAGNVLSVSAPATLALKPNFERATSYQDLIAPLQTCSDRLAKALKDVEAYKAPDNQKVDDARADVKKSIVDAKKEVDDLISEFRGALNRAQAYDSRAQRDYDISRFAAATGAFKKLSDLESNRRSAVSSLPQGSPTAESLKELLDEYNSQESIYAGYFLGKETVDTWIPYFEPIPPDEPEVDDKGNRKSAPNKYPEYGVDLFKYLPDGVSSLSAGICLDSAFASISIPMKFKTKSCNDPSKQSEMRKVQTVLSTSFSSATEMAARFRDASADGDRSYYFRIPAHATARVVDAKQTDKSEVAHSTVLIAQWGVIASLPADTGGSGAKYSVELSPTTGALMNFAVDSDSKLSGTDLTGLESGSKAITDQLAIRRNELKKLQNEEQTLEQRCKINAIRKVNDPSLDCSSVPKQ